MPLRLKALTAKEPGFAGQERLLDKGSITIGRSPDSDWPLKDDERQISKAHCRIDSRDDKSELIDLSSNGVFFEGDEAPLGLGVRRLLRAGDVFLVGDYRFMVTQDAPAPVRPPVDQANNPVTISEILGGSADGSEARASRAVSGDAPQWLGDLPKGAADGLLQAPFGWDAPPATVSALPIEAPVDFASGLSDANEHIAAVGGTIRVPEVRTVLPDDWFVAPASTPTAAEPAAASVASAAVLPSSTTDLQSHRRLLDAAGLAPAQLRDKLPDAVLGRAGILLRTVVEGLQRLSATIERVESDLGLLGDATAVRAAPAAVADLLDPDGSGDADVAAHLSDLMKRVRDLGEAVRVGATDVGNHLRPDGVERRARAGMIIPVWPNYRQACWRQYVLDFDALRRAGGAEPADVVLEPVRAAFARMSRRDADAPP